MALLFMFRIVLSYWCLATVVGLPGFRDKIPNGYNVPSWAGVGHLMPEGGGPRNQFGLDFAAAGYNWTTALCQLGTIQLKSEIYIFGL
jgi:dopamine beta-monooxygenase